MAIYLPSTAEEEQVALDELTPREIVAELDKHVIGQNAAKRAVSIALRNRMVEESQTRFEFRSHPLIHRPPISKLNPRRMAFF